MVDPTTASAAFSGLKLITDIFRQRKNPEEMALWMEVQQKIIGLSQQNSEKDNIIRKLTSQLEEKAKRPNLEYHDSGRYMVDEKQNKYCIKCYQSEPSTVIGLEERQGASAHGMSNFLACPICKNNFH